MRRYWISVLSNIAYPIAGLLAGPVTGLTFTILGVSSAGFHWYEHEKDQLGAWWKRTPGYRWQVADRISMYLVFWSIIWVMGPRSVDQAVFCGGMFLVMAALHNLFDRMAVGLLAAVVLALKVGASPVTGWIATGVFVVAFGLRQLGEDAGVSPDAMHGLWHVLTAFGLLLLAEGFHFY